MIRIAVLLSGRHSRGSNMAAIASACAEGQIDGKITHVIGNHADSPALERASELGLDTAVVPSPTRKQGGPGEDLYGILLLSALSEAAPDLICLAGYMRRVPPRILAAYEGRIMNIHAALLPSFGGQGMWGAHIHEAALAYGVKVSGCTVHFVDEHYDTGPIILQTAVPVEDDDTPDALTARVLVAEHQTYPRAVALFAQNRLTIEGRRVVIAPEQR